MLKQHQRYYDVMEERCQLLNDPPPHILGGKNEVSEQKW